MKITLEDQIKELERELGMRETVYAGLIKAGKLTKDQANKQYLAMQEALKTLHTYRDLNKDLKGILELFYKLK